MRYGTDQVVLQLRYMSGYVCRMGQVVVRYGYSTAQVGHGRDTVYTLQSQKQYFTAHRLAQFYRSDVLYRADLMIITERLWLRFVERHWIILNFLYFRLLDQLALSFTLFGRT